MPRKLPKLTKRDAREPVDLTETITVIASLMAKWRSEKLPEPLDVWLGPRERAGLLRVIREKTKADRSPDLVRAVLRGDPEGTTLMGLVVRSMTKPGVRIGVTLGPLGALNG